MANASPAASRHRAGKPIDTRHSNGRASTRILLARGDHVQAIHIRPRTVLGVGVAFALFSVLYFGATGYLLMRDGIIKSSGDQQEQLLEGYEDRITALRNEIDRISSRRAVDHATVAEKVDRLLDMQQTLDERQQLLARLADAARRAGFDIPPPIPPARPADGPQASAQPVAKPIAMLASAAGDAALPAAELDRVEGDIATMQAEQQQFVGGLVVRVGTRADRLARVLSRLGVRAPAPKAENVGGPYVPIDAADRGLGSFGGDVETLAEELERFAAVRRLAEKLPLARPIADAGITSGFGPRLDPFLGRPAMHTGIDFRAERGAPAHAVAAGVVVAAEWNGGYGKMVDVDLGNGIVTRFGHLSAISVNVGERVQAGTIIGRVGSTGRSTGPHLHYEIRVGGEPIDPMRYLKAGDEITALL